MSPRISTRSPLDSAFSGWPPPVLDPAGPYAGSITLLTWVLIAVTVLVFGIVLAALWIAFFGKDRTRAKLGGTKTIWGAGIIFPVVVLTALLVYGLRLTGNLTSTADSSADMRARITGEMWWWRVAYLGPGGEVIAADANELHIPAGRTILLELESADVIHSFWVPRLSGKVDMIPGRRNHMRIKADRPGVYGAQCAEYCGGPHALMGFVVVAHEPAAFERLIADRAAASARTAGARRTGAGAGEALFESAGCAACHRIAGTPANGLAGPDLTFVGSRQSIGAGILPNNRGTLMGWIGNSQRIKPGNRMPSYDMLSANDLQALAVYLEQQR